MKNETIMKLSRGFTLIELLVVIAVLLFVVGTAIGIFISVVNHQRIILNEQELLNQTSYVLEHMSKALRMAGKDWDGSCLGEDYIGHNYLLTHQNLSSGFYEGIKFINQSDNSACQEFYLDTSAGTLKEIKNNGDAIAITSDKFIINFIRFGINGKNGSASDEETDNEGVQPRVTIYLDIQTDGDSDGQSKKIQTTVSQRDLNAQQ